LIVNEAMACGKPSIVSEACGCAPDLIEEGETGYRFQLGNIKALADCLRRFGKNRDQDWSGKVRRKVAEYSMAQATEGLVKAIRSN